MMFRDVYTWSCGLRHAACQRCMLGQANIRVIEICNGLQNIVSQSHINLKLHISASEPMETPYTVYASLTWLSSVQQQETSRKKLV